VTLHETGEQGPTADILTDIGSRGVGGITDPSNNAVVENDCRVVSYAELALTQSRVIGDEGSDVGQNSGSRTIRGQCNS